MLTYLIETNIIGRLTGTLLEVTILLQPDVIEEPSKRVALISFYSSRTSADFNLRINRAPVDYELNMIDFNLAAALTN